MDWLKLALYPMTYCGVAIVWILCSKQEDLERSAATVVWVSIRIIIVCWLLLYFLYHTCGLSANFLLVVLPVSLLAIAIASFERPSWSSPEGLAFALALLMPVYLCKQFVLGFPDRHKLLLEPPDPLRQRDSQQQNHQDLIGRTGYISAPLRPMGSVNIEGTEYPAQTNTGFLLDSGVRITVRHVSSDTLIVEQFSADSPS